MCARKRAGRHGGIADYSAATITPPPINETFSKWHDDFPLSLWLVPYFSSSFASSSSLCSSFPSSSRLRFLFFSFRFHFLLLESLLFFQRSFLILFRFALHVVAVLWNVRRRNLHIDCCGKCLPLQDFNYDICSTKMTDHLVDFVLHYDFSRQMFVVSSCCRAILLSKSLFHAARSSFWLVAFNSVR